MDHFYYQKKKKKSLYPYLRKHCNHFFFGYCDVPSFIGPVDAPPLLYEYTFWCCCFCHHFLSCDHFGVLENFCFLTYITRVFYENALAMGQFSVFAISSNYTPWPRSDSWDSILISNIWLKTEPGLSQLLSEKFRFFLLHEDFTEHPIRSTTPLIQKSITLTFCSFSEVNL